jgi:hypothetical protein
MPTCKVSLATDTAIQLYTTGHPYAPAPPPLPAPTPAPVGTAIELPAPHFWPLGFGTHKQTTTVKHMLQPICQDGQDVGRMIVHVQLAPAPNNALLPLIMFKSSRKNNFSAPMVKMNKTPVGFFLMLNWPPMPMTSCSEPFALPTACSTTSWTNSVIVGVSWASYVISALTLIANLLVDRYLRKRDEALKSKGILDEIKAMRKTTFFGGLMSIDDMAAVGLKSAVAAASSVARLAFTNDDGSFPLIAGAPYGVEITRTADGKYGIKGSATLTKGNLSAKASAGISEDGSNEVGVVVTHKSKDGSKDSYGQDASAERSAGVSRKQDKDGKVEVAGQITQKDSEGNSQSAQVKQTTDSKNNKSSVSAEVSDKDAHGHERKVTAETTETSKTVDGKTTTESTDKLGYSNKSAVGEMGASTSEKHDSSGNVVQRDSEASVTPRGMEPSKTQSTTTYPTTPKPPASESPLGASAGPSLT